MSELFVRAALPDFDKPEPFETRDDFARSKNGDGSHVARLCDSDRFSADELCFAWRLAILEEHSDYELEIGAQLFLGFGLTVSARETGDIPHEEASIGVTLYDSGEGAHTQLYRGVCHLPATPQLALMLRVGAMQASARNLDHHAA